MNLLAPLCAAAAPVPRLFAPLRTLEGLAFVVLLGGLTATGLAMAWTQFETRRAWAELQALNAERDRALETTGRLLLERSTLASLARVDVRAREDLGMREPRLDEVRTLEPRP